MSALFVLLLIKSSWLQPLLSGTLSTGCAVTAAGSATSRAGVLQVHSCLLMAPMVSLVGKN